MAEYDIIVFGAKFFFKSPDRLVITEDRIEIPLRFSTIIPLHDNQPEDTEAEE